MVSRFEDHKSVKERLLRSQEAETDKRQEARDADHFCFDKDGQWEQNVVQKMGGRPRYTFDKVSPIIEDIMGEVEDMEFASRIDPAGDGADKETAKTIAGIVRYIENLSKAPRIYQNATRRIIRRGIDFVRVKTDWAEGDRFEQDIFITQVNNSVDRVWLGPHEEPDGSDADEGWQLHVIPTDEYERLWPEGSKQSVEDNVLSTTYWYKRKYVTVGEYLYKKPFDKEIALMSNGATYEVDENFEKVTDELRAEGITEERRKPVKSYKVYSRFFDGGDWLEGEKELPFVGIPLVPDYGNFDVVENKLIYSGIVFKLMDAQRVYNYARSREIEEGALAPRKKLMMTKKQAKGHEKQLKNMNTSADPVQFFNPDQEAGTVPFETAGPQVNPNLANTAAASNQDMLEQSGTTPAMQGANPMYQSGEAIKQQISKGDTKTVRWLNCTSVMIKRVTELVISAIPKVYDTKRQLQIINSDGTDEVITINEEIFDYQSGQMVTLNDTSRGKYSVEINVDQAFKSRRAEAAQRLTAMAEVDPAIIQEAGDIIYSSLDIPDSDKISERKREQMLQAGFIPESQMTDEEKEKTKAMAEQAAQQQQMDPAMMLEMKKAEGEILRERNREKQLEIDVIKLQQRDSELALKAESQQMDNMTKAAGIDEKVAKTAETWAKTEVLTGEAQGKQLDNLQKVTPQVTVVAGAQ
ncbi:portal protein [Vibrio sp. SCSIO 43136]|uniref:portal protein n=1 Tax=Vibrio sp. SCSIO 43136 TaxID=2819101 RepID=UPI00207603B0|nr:portal protein [Vibrio sp. SCSIO 43136]USD64218.1 hypothetical protein J4N39_08850 [Vibrio sp. SCSIO 43136]